MFVTFVNRTGGAVLVEARTVKTKAFASFSLGVSIGVDDSNRIGDRGERVQYRWVRGTTAPNDKKWVKDCVVNPDDTVVLDNSPQGAKCMWTEQR